MSFKLPLLNRSAQKRGIDKYRSGISLYLAQRTCTHISHYTHAITTEPYVPEKLCDDCHVSVSWL